MQFYHISRIDEAWERAKAQYREGLLPGVSGMKVSTAKPNSNARDPQVKVMIFYCGSESDEPGTLAVGRTILEQMQYTGRSRCFTSSVPITDHFIYQDIKYS